ECPNQCNDRSEDAGETFVVDCLDGLGIVSDPETGITRTSRIVISERERLEIRVEIRPQLKQGLQPDFHEQVIRDPIDGSPEELDRDQRQTQQGNPHTPIARNCGAGTQEIVDDYFKWPGLEQIQTNTDNRQKQSEDRLPKEWAVITEDAPVD